LQVTNQQTWCKSLRFYGTLQDIIMFVKGVQAVLLHLELRCIVHQ
jgi:hypothetical protein